MLQISHFCEIHSLSYEASKFFNHRKSMGQILGRSCPPGVQLLPHFEVWSYIACQPLQVWWFISFTKFSVWATTRQSLPNALSIGLFGRLFAKWATLGRSCPQGCKFLPHCVVCSYRACQPLQMWQISHSTKSTLWAMSLWIFCYGARQWLLGRGQWVLRWFRIGCLLPRVKRAHPSCFMTLLSWDIPLISFNGSLWDVLLRCSKWLLGAWLDSFTMILRCWLVVWIKWAPPPCLYDTVIQSYVQLKSGFFPSSMGANFGTLLPPRGASFTPLCGMFLQSPSASSNVANFHISTKSTLWAMSLWILVAKVVDNGC